MGCGRLIYWRWSRLWGTRCGAAGIALLLFFGNALVAKFLLGSLEDDYPYLEPGACPRADAIVVLGGGVTYPPAPARKSIEVGDGFDRLLHGMRLLRAERAPLLVLSGRGMPLAVELEMTEAARMRSLALEYKVDPALLLLEERSRNTYENALYTRELQQQRGLERILLVTSALHMRRAAAAFRTQGLKVIPAPTDIRVGRGRFSLAEFLPTPGGLLYSTMAMEEYIGMLAYRLKGWIK